MYSNKINLTCSSVGLLIFSPEYLYVFIYLILIPLSTAYFLGLNELEESHLLCRFLCSEKKLVMKNSCYGPAPQPSHPIVLATRKGKLHENDKNGIQIVLPG